MRRICDEEGRCFVYCYIRRTNNETGKKGQPYYIGIASTKKRPYEKHSCPIPYKNDQLIRILRETDTFEEACDWEIFYIAHYGRYNVNDGPLLNRTDGGSIGLGRIVSEETRKLLSEQRKGKLRPESVKEAIGKWAREERTPAMLEKMSKYAKNRSTEHQERLKKAALITQRNPKVREAMSRTKASKVCIQYGITTDEHLSLTESEAIAIRLYCKAHESEASWEVLGREWFKGIRRGQNDKNMQWINKLAKEEGITPDEWMEKNPKYGPFISKNMAIERGYNQFYVGHVCRKGHRSSFFVSDHKCGECKKQQNQASSKKRLEKEKKEGKDGNAIRKAKNAARLGLSVDEYLAMNWDARKRLRIKLGIKTEAELDADKAGMTLAEWKSLSRDERKKRRKVFEIDD